jgi:transcriptional regulator GlxA family with amidase domain
VKRRESVVLDRLVDVLLVQLLRAWLAGRPESSEPSWLGALRDPVVGAAVGLMHDAPAKDWTTSALAREVAVSRSTLSRRFTTVVGESPGSYLTRWRMDLAARRLRDTDDSLEAIASAVGYDSVYAFSRAFRRSRSEPPGRYRVGSRQAAAPT